MDGQYDGEQNAGLGAFPGLGQQHGEAQYSQEAMPAQAMPINTDDAGLGMSLKILRWFEWRGLALDHAALRKQGAGDTWWMCQNEEMHGPYDFEQITKALVCGGGTISVVQNTKAQEENPPWRNLTYKPLWNRRWVAMLWSVAFWGICGALGFCVVQSFLPFGTQIRFYGDIGYWVLFVGALVAGRVRRKNG